MDAAFLAWYQAELGEMDPAELMRSFQFLRGAVDAIANGGRRWDGGAPPYQQGFRAGQSAVDGWKADGIVLGRDDELHATKALSRAASERGQTLDQLAVGPVRSALQSAGFEDHIPEILRLVSAKRVLRSDVLRKLAPGAVSNPPKPKPKRRSKPPTAAARAKAKARRAKARRTKAAPSCDYCADKGSRRSPCHACGKGRY
jgi:hypothetical protein